MKFTFDVQALAFFSSAQKTSHHQNSKGLGWFQGQGEARDLLFFLFVCLTGTE